MLIANLSGKEDMPAYKENPGIHTYGVVYLKREKSKKIPFKSKSQCK